MLRNRSRAVTNKQNFMADQISSLSPTKNPNSSSFLNSPRFFSGFFSKSTPSDAESPTSILDTKNSTHFINPFGCDKNLSKSLTPFCVKDKKSEPEGIGLVLVDSLDEAKNHEKITFSPKSINRMSLFGSKLKVQIPAIENPYSNSPVKSPDFGIKTRNSHLLSPFITGTSPGKSFARQLSLKEMELSEDYTRVIIHGPNPKTTHIFDDCVVECGFEIEVSNSSPENFMSFCHTCKKDLEQGKDVYVYRGERAFCSHECRCQEMLFEEMKNPEIEFAVL